MRDWLQHTEMLSNAVDGSSFLEVDEKLLHVEFEKDIAWKFSEVRTKSEKHARCTKLVLCMKEVFLSRTIHFPFNVMSVHHVLSAWGMKINSK